jgi:Arc/MetJ-type ribon-helix-helix transcriptional regulator
MGATEKRQVRKNFVLPMELAQEAENAASDLHVSLSDFVRMALRDAIQRNRRSTLVRELQEGYAANFEFLQAENRLWESADPTLDETD